MNRLILKHGVAVTVVILAIFAWVIYSREAAGGIGAILQLASVAIVVWVVATFIFIYYWPRITVGGFKRIFTKRGLGAGPIPVNSIYAVPGSPSESASPGSVIATGTDDVLYVGGWIDLKTRPQVLHVPTMDDRYYSVQFTDPSSESRFQLTGGETARSASLATG